MDADLPEFDVALVDAADTGVVGRRREIEIVVGALAAARHILLEGPPGTGKSTLLRAIADHAGIDLVFVEGNAELTPARLVGHFDPAQVLAQGYSPDVYVDGPLLAALRDGGLLYVEEINRVPEETLNLLVTVMSEREISIPRLGRIPAHQNFRLVAAMNPFDAVGTARIAGAIYDRVNRLAVDYQDEADELEIVRHAAGESPLTERAVRCVRLSRSHPDVRVGSSVRGAIDLVLLAQQLAALRGVGVIDVPTGVDAATTALSGRIRLQESSGRTAEEVVIELWQAAAPREDGERSDNEGKA